jgi:hypothetical protein
MEIIGNLNADWEWLLKLSQNTRWNRGKKPNEFTADLQLLLQCKEGGESKISLYFLYPKPGQAPAIGGYKNSSVKVLYEKVSKEQSY